MTIDIGAPEALDQAAGALYDFAAGQQIFVFFGEMGAGKTTFIKAFCRRLGVTGIVSSPTFSIVNVYDRPAGPVYHFDFYRLKRVEEAYDLGYEEYFYSGDVCLIEWPERIDGLLPETYVRIDIAVTGPSSRRFSFQKSTG
ncbi:tRNA (adenosine(37)-N6)-threonylcarbamoyltransferase complex ATPase subunit type 1 TsaE [Pedobacter yulinensis]|uniref:tRNA threonylcarbamoyladenosine biosynthesis protein TsaE n=1 Tax=Pedobacter yulinensis TaxID=2126353 RepID=A0A2T3HRM0_9SPHI|nr:tRNA (adenosine(37)-N6)-threonylcarbamoyltransferase complex ATPase subunit type 1 TsaE [Pedobacter yulinensis]PST85092.1 tRNA (adenosine(37)-N6)-threonylcarbamoyltransferase complex ATPase subunit type 1 TsaE [Pedobacter yulinensis]